jgi:hypothetical protein
VALFVAGVLGDERMGFACESALPWDDRVQPLRAALLEWLGNVGESAAFCDGTPDPGEAEQACQAIRAALYRAVAPFIWDPVAAIWIQALRAASHLLHAPDLVDNRQALAQRLLKDVPLTGPVERAHLAFVLDRWGIAPRALLLDPDQRARACAAVATALDDDPAALAEVRAALRFPDAVNHWFDDRDEDPQRTGWFLHTLVRALVRRTMTFEDVEVEAIAIAAAPNSYARQRCIDTLLETVRWSGMPYSLAVIRFRQAVGRPSAH